MKNLVKSPSRIRLKWFTKHLVKCQIQKYKIQPNEERKNPQPLPFPFVVGIIVNLFHSILGSLIMAKP